MDRFDRLVPALALLPPLRWCGCFGPFVLSSDMATSARPARAAYLLIEMPKASDRSQIDFSTGARGVLDKCVWWRLTNLIMTTPHTYVLPTLQLFGLAFQLAKRSSLSASFRCIASVISAFGRLRWHAGFLICVSMCVLACLQSPSIASVD